MLDRDEIEKRLKDVDPQLRMAFAARCCLRVFPFLVVEKGIENFCYWDKKDKPQHLLALFSVLQRCINFSALGGVDIDNSVLNAVHSSANDAHLNPVATNSSIARATIIIFSNAAATLTNSVNRATGDACSFASNVAHLASINFYMNLEKEIFQDLGRITEIVGDNPFLKKWQQKIISPINFLYSPLWNDASNSEWQPLYSRFNQALLDLNADFEPWIGWYKDRVNGKPLNRTRREVVKYPI